MREAMFILDSNMYIEDCNNSSFALGFRGFHQTHLPRIILSAVVLSELLVGANSRNRERVLRRTRIEPFRSRGRILVPTLQTWESASAVDEALNDGFDIHDIEYVLLNGHIRRTWPRDGTYEIVGLSLDQRPLGVVCRMTKMRKVRVITVYEDQPQR